MNPDLELLSIGDASLDVFIMPTESETLCQINDKDSLLCFSYGDKIPAKDLQFSIGGNAANNSVGTRRLGINSAAVLSLGDDDIGHQIKNKLESESVNTSFVTIQPDTRSNYSTVINVGGERTILTYKGPRDYHFPDNPPVTPWIYLTSMGDSFRPFYEKVIEFVKANPIVKLAFNPGSRQLRDLPDIQDILAISHIVYINRHEAEMITGLSETEGKEKDLLKAVADKGAKIPIVTDGGGGSYIYDGDRFIRAGVLPIDAFERTGAGDSFGAGCIAALIKGKTLEEALLWGTVNSASVIGFIGSQKGLLRDSELPAWIDRAKSCNLKIEEF
jgi:sugar/nucleoside kinase (ribokinase family)